MLYLIAIVVGGALGLYLVQSGRITSPRLVSGFYAVLGGILGIMILRFLLGGLGPIGAIIGATVGAMILLFAAQQISGPKD